MARVTVKQLEDRLDIVQQQLEEAVRGQRQLKDHRKGLQRGSRERKVLDRRISSNQRKLEGQAEQLRLLRNRLENLGEHMTDAHAAAITEEQKRLDSQAKAFNNDVNAQLVDVRKTLSDHESTLNLHGEQIARAQDCIDDIVEAPALTVDPHKSSVDVSGKIEHRTPWGMAFVVGLAAGLMTYYGLMLNDLTVFESVERTRMASVIIGVAGMLVMASFENINLKLSSALKWADYQLPDRSEEPDMTELLAIESPDETAGQEVSA